MLYFAYGSNMDPERMRRRGVVYTSRLPARLPGYRLAFNKVASSQPPGVGYANIVPDPMGQVEGALYTVQRQSLSVLDACEGYPRHYRRVSSPVVLADGSQSPAMFYVAAPHRVARGLRPTRRYLAHLLAARDILSPSYYETLANTPTYRPAHRHGLRQLIPNGSRKRQRSRKRQHSRKRRHRPTRL